MTRLCVAIFVTDLAKARRDIAYAAEHGADLVELRVDTLNDLTILNALLADNIVPAIVTCRPPWEGGLSKLEDIERGELLLRAETAAFIDVELKTIAAHPEEVELMLAERAAQPTRLIVSSHDFVGRPDRLHNILADLNNSPADIAKIVWTARSIRDNCEAFEILRHSIKPTIALCMGEAGLPSRVLAKKFGAFLTFASLDASNGTAPGQVSIDDMKILYRWDAIRSDTRVFGVVGSPIAHSMSPAIHNAAFDATGFNGVYLPLLVNPGYESFKAFLETWLHCDGLDLTGLSITIPHKENALRYLKEIGADVEPLAEQIGAVNTIVIDGKKIRGMNTDYAAILDTITTALSIDRGDLKGKRVAVLGAGGTGRTAVAGLAAYGATVVVYNRTRERADALAAEFNGRTGKVVAADWAKLCDSCCDIFINTTNVGMHPNVDASPFGDRLPTFNADTLVFDAIYNPPHTKLLRDAAAAGAKTVGGVDMFVHQAAAQFAAWTRFDAPKSVMRKVIDWRLGVR